MVGGAPVLAVVAYFVLPFRGDRWPVAAVAGLVAAAACIPVTKRRIARIRTSERPMVDALTAVSILASLTLVGFAASYYAIATNTDQFSGIATKIDSLYFTVVTTGTVGFGDITPVGQAARALVALQILINLTLLGGAVRLVAYVARERRSPGSSI